MSLFNMMTSFPFDHLAPAGRPVFTGDHAFALPSVGDLLAGVPAHGLAITRSSSERDYSSRNGVVTVDEPFQILGPRRDFIIPRKSQMQDIYQEPPFQLVEVPRIHYVPKYLECYTNHLVEFTSHGIQGVPLSSLNSLDESSDRGTLARFKDTHVRYRLCWPGYRVREQKRRIREETRYYKCEHLAMQVLELMEWYFENREENELWDKTGSYRAWRLGPDGITLDDIFLLGLDLVSPQAVVQPIFAVRNEINVDRLQEYQL
ncbi:hypothetical protein NM688_g4585 [Phlebia brevispora]|uniref:Uncharacterized protein n=1 Tax=Phlebia brevispora TaxID=194682 RepID=A0ACC1T2I0_9APHY|nr:hypothetical protein NM688_g4585 [Phlebia brevispora]